MYMGAPAILIPWANNQEPIASSVIRMGSAISVNPRSISWTKILEKELLRLILDHKTRVKLAYSERSLIDGLGAMRVIQALDTSKPVKAY